MKKDKLIKTVSVETGLKKKRCEEIFDYMIELISSELKNKREVIIDGVGSFGIIRESMKIKLSKKEKTMIPPRDVIEFKLSEVTKEK